MSPASPSSRPDPRSRAYQEVWYLKLNDPAAQRALWLRFTVLVSRNGFRRLAETWAVYSRKESASETTKLAVKQTHELSAFSSAGGDEANIGQCVLTGSKTRGSIVSKGRSVEWDLEMRPNHAASFDLIPDFIQRSGIVKNNALTTAEDLRFTGKVTLDGNNVIAFNDAPGMRAHLSGTKNGNSWVWGHCNAFVDAKGEPADFIFEGLSAKGRMAGGLSTPRLSTFFFRYGGKDYAFRSLWDVLNARSRYSITEWTFRVDRGDLSFRGEVRAEHKDFAGLIYEDTDGSLLYCANSKLSTMQVHVYRRGKLDSSFTSNGTAAFEVVSREKNPYVPILL